MWVVLGSVVLVLLYDGVFEFFIFYLLSAFRVLIFSICYCLHLFMLFALSLIFKLFTLLINFFHFLYVIFIFIIIFVSSYCSCFKSV